MVANLSLADLDTVTGGVFSASRMRVRLAKQQCDATRDPGSEECADWTILANAPAAETRVSLRDQALRRLGGQPWPVVPAE